MLSLDRQTGEAGEARREETAAVHISKVTVCDRRAHLQKNIPE